MSGRINAGLIGAGRIGRLHAEQLALRIPEANLVAMSDIILTVAQKCGAESGISAAAHDHRVMMQNPIIEAVIVCSSTETPSQMIEPADGVGRHISCEKPIDFEQARIDRALAAVERVGAKLQIGLDRRCDPTFGASGSSSAGWCGAAGPRT